MKRFLLILAILPMLLMGCSKDGAENQSGDGGVKFLPSTYADNITEYVWGGGDKVAIYMVTLDENINSVKTEFSEYQYVTATRKLEATLPANVLKVPNERSVHFVSYVPYGGTQITKSGDLMTVNTNVQTTYKNIDLLFANDGILYNKLINTDVKLTYDHMMSKIVLRFNSVDPAKLLAVTTNSITIKGMPNQVKFNLVTKAYSALAEQARDVVVTSKVSVTPADATVEVYEAIVVPQPDGWVTTPRSMMFGAGSLEMRQFNRSDAYEKGMKYVYNIDLDDTGEVVLGKPTVVEWGDGGTKPIVSNKIVTPLFTDPVFEEWVRWKFCDGRADIRINDLKDVKTIRIHRSELNGSTVIDNLDGLEAFISLDTLDVSNRIEANAGGYPLGFEIKGVNLANNSQLRYAWLMGNQLTKLDVSNNYKLSELNCHTNLLTEINLSNNSELLAILASSNQLSVLDISNNRKLEQVGIGGGDNITSLDLSNAPELNYMACQGSNLTSLDLSKNPKLTSLFCDKSYITSLNLSNNIELTRLQCGGIGAWPLAKLILPTTNKITHLLCNGALLTSLDMSNHYDITKIIVFRCDLNPGNGDSSGSVIPADFVIKLPASADLAALPPIFTQALPWNYQFEDAAGAPVGVVFRVKPIYTK